MHVTAVIAAAGRGARLGGDQPKQLLSVGGRPMLERAVGAFAGHPAVSEVVVALTPELLAHPPAYLVSPSIRIVAGGLRRQDSVANAVRAASDDTDVIVVHDAARPFVTADLISRTIDAAARTGAALAAIAVRDTVKIAAPDSSGATRSTSGPLVVRETIPRETVFLAQTPQAFRREILIAALEARGDVHATDEASLVERYGHPVQIVEGDASNIKVTSPEDMTIVEAIAETLRIADCGSPSAQESAIQSGARAEIQSAVQSPIPDTQSAMGRAGTGYDLHRLVEGRPLVLGGVVIPAAKGALGHSDADVICHAITDAILGAACQGDIGRHFSDTDPRWKDASSLDMLKRTAAIVAAEGLEVGNIDVTVILQSPKIRDHIGRMRDNVATAVGIDASRVSIKAKTNEGVDAIGRGEAIAAHAIALLRAAGRRT
jgi:2-C-methyl-D-erythritol 4-phosphate cytidylyltransferase/2-C-methyl-D-erythritol 2,4-cyclodiphosphate synthase